MRIKLFVIGFVLGALTFLVSTLYPAEVLNIQKLSNLPKFGVYSDPQVGNLTPAIRFGSSKEKSTCSGTVIDKNYILTAAHCLIDARHIMTKTPVYVRGQSDADYTEAKPAGVNLLMDVGLLIGDFSKYTPMKVSLSTQADISGSAITISCGYPMGQASILCTPVGSLHVRGFTYAGYSFLVPAMSGGPVMQEVAGIPTIVGVNQSVYFEGALEENSRFSIITGLLGAFGI